jgi:hypothetical protein
LISSQKTAKLFSSKEKFDKIKQESKLWVFSCSSCNESSSIWEIGGVRDKAKGKPIMRLRCPKCDTVGMQKTHNRSAEEK